MVSWLKERMIWKLRLLYTWHQRPHQKQLEPATSFFIKKHIIEMARFFVSARWSVRRVASYQEIQCIAPNSQEPWPGRPLLFLILEWLAVLASLRQGACANNFNLMHGQTRDSWRDMSGPKKSREKRLCPLSPKIKSAFASTWKTNLTWLKQ